MFSGAGVGVIVCGGTGVEVAVGTEATVGGVGVDGGVQEVRIKARSIVAMMDFVFMVLPRRRQYQRRTLFYANSVRRF